MYRSLFVETQPANSCFWVIKVFYRIAWFYHLISNPVAEASCFLWKALCCNFANHSQNVAARLLSVCKPFERWSSLRSVQRQENGDNILIEFQIHAISFPALNDALITKPAPDCRTAMGWSSVYLESVNQLELCSSQHWDWDWLIMEGDWLFSRSHNAIRFGGFFT